MSKFMISAKPIANIAISYGRPTSSMALDKILSEIFYLRVINGPDLKYPTIDFNMLPNPEIYHFLSEILFNNGQKPQTV